MARGRAHIAILIALFVTVHAAEATPLRRLAAAAVDGHGKAVASIVGGHDALPLNRYPWMAHLYFKPNAYCGGMLIASRVVLTAAHCFKSFAEASGPPGSTGSNWIPKSDFPVYIDIGRYKLGPSDARGQRWERRRAVGGLVHPKFNPQTYRNDIAALVLDKPVASWRKPIQLAPPIDEIKKTGFKLPDGFDLTVLGWGMIREGGPNSKILQEATVNYEPEPKCKEFFRQVSPGLKYIFAEMICAGDPAKKQDTCQNDSGGPLFYKHPNGSRHDILVGITSFGIDCAESTPGVYTDVSFYRRTITGFQSTLLKSFPSAAAA